MNRLGKVLAGIAILAAGVAMLAPSPGASSEHFVIVNNNDLTGNNYGTVLKLAGTKQNPALNQVASLATGVASWEPGSLTPVVQVVRDGSDICVFLTESDETGNGEISAFEYPGGKLVGNFSTGNSSAYAGVIVTSQGYLYSTFAQLYEGDFLVSWKIEPGCKLNLVQQTAALHLDMFFMAATPDGKTLIASENTGDECCMYSFSIGTGGVLTEHGPYGLNGDLPRGIDVTADSKFVLVDMQGFGPPTDDDETEIDVLAINSDGSLGQEYDFGGDGSLGKARAGGWIRLSPNEKFLFVTDGAEDLTTLNFSETPVNVTWSGCLTTLRVPEGQTALSGSSIATAGTTGAGGGIYVSEAAQFAGNVAFLSVNPATGCTTEEKQSPLTLNDPNAEPWSLVAWPPRPF